MPLLSICIPTFNRKKYLEILLSQIEHLIQQDYLDIEICISDNSSDDGSWEYIKKFASQSSRVHIKRQEINIGGNRNLIDITSIASGKWILVIGDDDTLIVENLEKLLLTLPDLKAFNYILLNTKISENQNLLSMKDGKISDSDLKENLANGIQNFGFCGAHLFTQKIATVMRQRNYEDLRSWPSFGTFIYSAFQEMEDVYFFSLPVAWQDSNGHAMEWQPHHWLDLVLRQLQVFRLNYKGEVLDNFCTTLLKKHLFSTTFFKTFYSSFLYLPTETKNIMQSYKYEQLLNDISSFYSLFHKVIIKITFLIPVTAHHFLITHILRKELSKYIFTGDLDEKDGITQDPEILTKQND
jgi:glycosyltransferase involved in cell wall biosynthesis